jgi:hypothetical protein
LRSEAADLAEALGVESTLDDLALRLEHPEERTAASRLTRGILGKAGAASPLALGATTFNLCAESYYRDDLRRRHVEEALQLLAEDLLTLDRGAANDGYGPAIRSVAGESGATAFLARVRSDVVSERVTLEDLRRLTALVVLSIHRDVREAEALVNAPRRLADIAAPVHRAA